VSPLREQLDGIGRTVVRWRTLLFAVGGGSATAVLLAAGALADTAAHFNRPGRVAAAVLVFAAAGAALALAFRAAARRFSDVAISAELERAFPELDNRLINRIQFEMRPEKNPLELAYLSQPPPALGGLNLAVLRDDRAHRRAWLGFTAALLLLAAPAFWSAPAWSNALLRVLNPFSNRPPTLLARVLSVAPGDAVRLQGSPVVLSCQVSGRRGQPVSLELLPADGSRSTLTLGALQGDREESFSHTLESLTTATRYRFRAGDHAAALCTLTPRPPLAFASVSAAIEPPAYTKLEPRTVDALAGENPVPAGSLVRFRAACNFPLASCVVSNTETLAILSSAPEAGALEGSAVITNPAGLLAEAVDTDGFAASAPLHFVAMPDQRPQLQITAPLAPVVLTPGTAPRIQWGASDDYGLSALTLEQIEEAPGVTSRTVVASWEPAGAREWAGDWTGAPPPTNRSLILTFRLIARDNRPDAPQETVSPPIVFQSQSQEAALDEAAKNAAESRESLDALVRMQAENIARTAPLAAEPVRARPGQWKEIQAAQLQIRQLAGRLTADPRRPLGALKTIVDRLWQDEMPRAIDVLTRLPDAPAEAQRPLAAQALALEERILEALTRAQSGMAAVQEHKQITGLLALLDALIANQKQVRDATKPLPAGAAAPAALVDRQDGLAGNMAEFIAACRRESETLRKGDAAFADLLVKVAAQADSVKIGADMTRAAEQLESGAFPEAVAFQEKALANLAALQDLLNAWRVADAQAKAEELQQAAVEAGAKLEKLRQLQAKIVQSMREVDPQKDKSDKAYDELMEEVSAIKTNMAEALLNIARDLHIFPELPVGNDLVEDVFQVYEDMKQVPGSADDKAKESGLQKEDWILKMLENAKGRVDDMEMWLASKPDVRKANTENFDKNELPEVATLPMPTELEDLIGDLLEQEEEEKNKADDSATNQGSADIAAGWDVAEGEFVNFSAKGKSGNEAPDHKEQDGRSLVGRQGMSDGETTAGSGKINEGDNNIEARRTRDSAQGGQVQEDGHAEAKATGGGKSSGYAEESGMAGAGPRRDAAMEGSELGLQSMLRKDAESLYAKASLMHVRTGALEDAVTALRRVEDALAGGRIQQVREFQKQAVAALKRARAELNSGLSSEMLPADFTGRPVSDQTAGVSDEAPEEFREMVSEYFKALNSAP
jgi:hypothetical protein